MSLTPTLLLAILYSRNFGWSKVNRSLQRKKVREVEEKNQDQEVISTLTDFELCERKCEYRGTVKSAVDSFGPSESGN